MTRAETTATQRFDAWGKLEQAAGSVPTYGYTGREPDATGLIHYRARYYHPEIGRFVSRDPLGLSAGINPYAYADGNPVLFNDPDGLMAALAWNSASSYISQNGTRILDGTQTVLDVAGLVPGFGELADGANALIYLGRGDNANAALSGAAMIPFIGWGATTAKVVGRVDNAVDVGKGEAAFFRGAKAGEAPSFVPKPGEFRVDPRTGFVKDTHGVSVFDNPLSVSSKGYVPHQIDQSSMPDSLRIIQRGGDPRHFEIVPKPGANLTPQQFTNACSSIVCVR